MLLLGMVLESLILGICVNYGHCDDLARNYFYYNPMVEENLKTEAELYKQKARDVLGDRMVYEILPITGMVSKGEATLSFPDHQSITLRIKPSEIAVSYYYNF